MNDDNMHTQNKTEYAHEKARDDMGKLHWLFQNPAFLLALNATKLKYYLYFLKNNNNTEGLGLKSQISQNTDIDKTCTKKSKGTANIKLQIETTFFAAVKTTY